jgi:hypothetical protein
MVIVGLFTEMDHSKQNSNVKTANILSDNYKKLKDFRINTADTVTQKHSQETTPSHEPSQPSPPQAIVQSIYRIRDKISGLVRIANKEMTNGLCKNTYAEDNEYSRFLEIKRPYFDRLSLSLFVFAYQKKVEYGPRSKPLDFRQESRLAS